MEDKELLVEYIESEVLNWLSDPHLLNIPSEMPEYKRELSVPFLPESELKVTIRSQSKYTHIQWDLFMTDNEAYLPENTTLEEFTICIINHVATILHRGVPDDISISELRSSDPESDLLLEDLNIASFRTPISTQKLGENLESVSEYRLNLSEEETTVYLQDENPKESVMRMLDLGSYETIFDSEVEEIVTVESV